MLEVLRVLFGQLHFDVCVFSFAVLLHVCCDVPRN